MSRLLFSLVLSIFLPTSVCKAEITVYDELPDQHTPPDILNNQNLQVTQHQDIEIHYGFSNLKFTNGPAQEIKIDHRPQEEARPLFSFVKMAEAAVRLTPEDFGKVCNRINEVNRLEDLKPVLSDNSFQSLKARVNAGASPYTVLAIIQAPRPQNIRIIDSKVEEDRAEVAVTGQSFLGSMKGLIHLVKIEDDWKIESENWYAEVKNSKDHIAHFVPPLPAGDKYDEAKSTGLLSDITPDYKINRKFLLLTKARYNKDRRTFNFVVLMNREKVKADKSEEISSLNGHQRKRMHILWTGGKKMMVEQKLIEKEYPIDISIANYEDGYAPGQLNLILPNKKPRQVLFTLLWSF